MQIRTVAVGLLAAMLTIAALPIARAAIDLPKWTPGDFWSYRFSVSAYPYGTMNGTLRLDVTGTEDVLAGGATYSTYAVEAVLAATMQGQTMTMTLDVWYRTSDLAIVREMVHQSYSGFDLMMRITYDPPPEVHWPLTPGATWSTSSSAFIETRGPTGEWFNQTTSVRSSYEVQAETQVTVPAGTFTAVGVRQSGAGMFMGSASTDYWSLTVGNAVRVVAEGSSAPTFDLTEYHYAATSWPSVFLTIAALAVPLAFVAGLLVWAIRRPRRAVPYSAQMPAPMQQLATFPQPWQPPPPQQPPLP